MGERPGAGDGCEARRPGAPLGPALERRLGVAGAAAIGLGSMVGAGAFVVTPRVTAGMAPGLAAGAVAIAAGVAMCNAMSSARLASAFPVAGGTYEYAHRAIDGGTGRWLGIAAGWLFLIAKSASLAAAAGGAVAVTAELSAGSALAAALSHPVGGRAAAAATLAAVTLLVLAGLRRSTLVVGVTTAVAMLVLLVAAAVTITAGASAAEGAPREAAPQSAGLGGFAPPLASAALLFVAFTGYGRIATMGEEVREPARTIPRAAALAVLAAGVAYAAVAVGSALARRSAGGESGASASLPVFVGDAAVSLGAPAGVGFVASFAVTAAALFAMLGVAVALLLGLSRVVLAMARRGDAPAALARLTGDAEAAGASSGAGEPRAAVRAAAAAPIVLALVFGDFLDAWRLSAAAVLVYYAITNVAALRLAPGATPVLRRPGRLIATVGLAGCVALAAALPGSDWLTIAAILIAAAAASRIGGTTSGRRPR